MNKTVRLALVAGVLLATAGVAIVAEAQSNASQVVAARKDGMRGVGRAVASLQPILRNEQPWNQQTAVTAMTTVRDAAAQISAWFPEGSGPQAGIETRALPAIWQQRQAFDQAAAGLGTVAAQLLQLAQANNEQGFRAGFAALGQACGSCHTPFRAPQ